MGGLHHSDAETDGDYITMETKMCTVNHRGNHIIETTTTVCGWK